MRPSSVQAAVVAAAPAAVYLLKRHDGLRFKIGWAVDPMERVKRLPEFTADELDLQASHEAWLTNPLRARQIERSLHRGLATHRAVTPHELEGHTEWFMPQALRTAMRMIRHMPAGGMTSAPPALVPFGTAPQPLLAAAATPDAGSAILVSAQDVLWSMEDLLLRVSSLTTVRVESQGDHRLVRLVDIRGPRARVTDSMRWALLDLDTYRWTVGGRSGSFVQIMQYEGNDLILQMTPVRTVSRWAEGGLVWQTMALMERLSGFETYKRAAARRSA
jgi:hypothetical protein